MFIVRSSGIRVHEVCNDISQRVGSVEVEGIMGDQDKFIDNKIKYYELVQLFQEWNELIRGFDWNR